MSERDAARASSEGAVDGSGRDALLAIAIGAATPLTFEVGRVARDLVGPGFALVLVPVLSAALFQPVWARVVRRGELGRATRLAQIWALACSIVTIALVANTGDRYADVLWNAEKYRTDMFHWVKTGIGEESEPARFLPLHALHFTAFCALSFVTFGFGGLALGAALLHYMNFYVGSLAAAASSPMMISILGWPPYAVVRVIGFVTVASALTALAFVRFRRAPIEPTRIRKMLLLGLALVIVDAVLKSIVAPGWGSMLRELL